MYPERSGEHPSTVPSGTAADTGKESTEREPARRDRDERTQKKDETGKKDAAKQH